MFRTKKDIKLSLLFLLLLGNIAKTQTVYNLWEQNKKPYYKENDLEEYQKEMFGTMCLFNVTEPTLTVYKAAVKIQEKQSLLFQVEAMG